MKKYFKNKKYVLLICLFFVGMAVASAAVTIFPSSEVTYDNTTSGLTATNVQAAIDELDASANSCPVIDPAILEAVPMLPTYQNLGEPDIVTSGDGLYVDNSEGFTRLIYKGANPDNYIYIKEDGVNQLYRIYSIEDDGTIKVIRDEAVISMNFDANDATRRKGGYCLYDYCNAWVAMDNFVNVDYSGTVAGLNGNSGDSSVKEYIDGTYANTLDDFSKIVSKTWNISGTTYNRDTLENAIADEKKSTWNGKIALLTASEYVRANTNTSSCGTLANLSSNYSTCKSTNYLVNSSNWWLLSPYSSNRNLVLTVNSSTYLTGYSAYHSYGVRPAFYLKSGLNLKGKGTQAEPYEIDERIVYAYHTDQKTIGTSAVTDGVSNYTQLSSYQNGKKWFLKYELDENNVIKNAWACMKFSFISNPVCLQGGSASYYASNAEIIKHLSSVFSSNGGSCSAGNSGGSCRMYSLYAGAYTDGDAVAYDTTMGVPCAVNDDGRVNCY